MGMLQSPMISAKLKLTLLKGLNVLAGKGDTDLVHLGSGGTGLVEVLLVVHFCDLFELGG